MNSNHPWHSAEAIREARSELAGAERVAANTMGCSIRPYRHCTLQRWEPNLASCCCCCCSDCGCSACCWSCCCPWFCAVGGVAVGCVLVEMVAVVAVFAGGAVAVDSGVVVVVVAGRGLTVVAAFIVTEIVFCWHSCGHSWRANNSDNKNSGHLLGNIVFIYMHM